MGERADELLSSMSEGYMVLDREFRVVEINPAGLEMTRLPADRILGRTHWEIWPASVGAPVEAAYRRAMAERVPAQVQQRFGDTDIWLEVRIYPLGEGVAAFFRDISDAKRAEEALRASEARLRIAQHAGGIGAYEWDLVTGDLYASDVARQLWGIAPDAPVTIAIAVDMIHPDDRPYAMPLSNRPIEELVGTAQYRIIRGDTGEVRWLARHVELVRDEAGRPRRVIGAFRDITEEKRFEERQQLLINELNHRVKNTLSTVQSIASQTLRAAPSLDLAREAFEERLLSLSRAHDVLTRQNWQGAGLSEIVRGAVAPYQIEGQERLQIAGPEVRLSPQVALALAMALQELATNAAKYGSLSRPSGRVEIAWRTERGRLFLRWAESGGPPVKEPKRRGFGSRLIERGLRGDIGGEAAIEFKPTGVVCTLVAALDMLAS